MKHSSQELHFSISVSGFWIYGYKTEPAMALCTIVAREIQVLSRMRPYLETLYGKAVPFSAPSAHSGI